MECGQHLHVTSSTGGQMVMKGSVECMLAQRPSRRSLCTSVKVRGMEKIAMQAALALAAAKASAVEC